MKREYKKIISGILRKKEDVSDMPHMTFKAVEIKQQGFKEMLIIPCLQSKQDCKMWEDFLNAVGYVFINGKLHIVYKHGSASNRMFSTYEDISMYPNFKEVETWDL